MSGDMSIYDKDILPRELVSIVKDYIDTYNIIDKHKRLMNEYVQRVTFNENDCDVSVERGAKRGNSGVFYYNYRGLKRSHVRYMEEDRIFNIYAFNKSIGNIRKGDISPNYIHQRLLNDV